MFEDAMAYNEWAAAEVFKSQSLPAAFVLRYFNKICPAPGSSAFAQGVMKFQAEHSLIVDGKLGTKTLGTINQVFPPEAHIPPEDGRVLLTEAKKAEIVGYTVSFEGGKGSNPYASLNRDAEYEGWFDQPKTKAGKKLNPAERAKEKNSSPHRASKYHPSGGFHVGLSYGAWQAAQEPGSLGQLLTAMQKKDPVLFQNVFGAGWQDLLRTTNATNRRTGVFSARTQKVGGAYLWQAPWTTRFQEAATHETFREAQRDWVAAQYLTPALEIAQDYNMDSQGDLAVLFDIAIQFGLGGLRKYVGAAKLVSGSKYSETKVTALINALPSGHRPRRQHILAAAGQTVRYVW